MIKKHMAAACLLSAIVFASAASVAQQADFPRKPNGVPDISGIWQSLNNANWNLEGQAAAQGPVEVLGAIGAVPPGKGIVVGDSIPYKPEALAQREMNFANRRTEDPEAKCFRPGIPRANYMAHPFQIFQTDSDILVTYQFAGALRTIYMDNHMNGPIDSWMGWSNGHWEGDTLVVEVGALNPNWLDRAGNYYSRSAKVTERYTPISPYHLQYEATIEDPEVYEEPWSISMPLYRRVEEGARLYDFKCVEFAEEIMYQHLSRENYFRERGIELNGDSNE